jgi:3-hydroxybutyryl-CoA dehydrogenase
MNILVIGDSQNFEECTSKFGDSHIYTHVVEHREAAKFLASDTLVFDFSVADEPHQMEIYLQKSVIAFLNTTKASLAELTHPNHPLHTATLFGFNGMPTFLNRPLLEVSIRKKEDSKSLEIVCQKLGTSFSTVEDRVGLVTPRIVCMIINEAFYTVQEGTASREDIDRAMKLGTNYPFGPFEWCKRIGIANVYELLHAVYEDTKDERYRICPLLKQEYLKQ